MRHKAVDRQYFFSGLCQRRAKAGAECKYKNGDAARRTAVAEMRHVKILPVHFVFIDGGYVNAAFYFAVVAES